ANPYHIREMNRGEFEELLREHFEYVEIFEQYIQASVLIAQTAAPDQFSQMRHLAWGDKQQSNPEPAVYIAMCSHVPLPRLDGASYMDFRTNFIKQELQAAEQLNRTRFDYFAVAEKAATKDVLADLHARNLRIAALETELHAHNLHSAELESALHARNLRAMELESELHARNLRVLELESELHIRNLRVLELEQIETETKTELARYNWVRKIDRLLIKR
ncbi:MAG TPA: hypothetical protein VK832_11500, partial [Burkholderiaceae bacterium]|nr:hypothetical protein [Burkholderiaceae bacterium]